MGPRFRGGAGVWLWRWAVEGGFGRGLGAVEGGFGRVWERWRVAVRRALGTLRGLWLGLWVAAVAAVAVVIGARNGETASRGWQ